LDIYIGHVVLILDDLMLELLRPKVAFVTVTSPYEVGVEKAVALQEHALRSLTRTGLQTISVEKPVQSDAEAFHAARELLRQEPDAFCILYGTYADDTFATTIIEQSDLPAIVWGTNQFDSGSMAGAQQVTEVLSEMGRYYKPVFGDVDDDLAVREVVKTARVAAARRRLRASRVGVIGYQRIKGQTQASFDEIELRRKIGCRVAGISMYLFRTLMAEVAPKRAREVWQEVSRGVKRISVDDTQIMDGVKAYLAMKKIVQDNKLDAVAIEDWNEIIGIPNLGLSLLNEEGVPAGCEADVHTTAILYLMALLTGKPTFHGELLGILKQEDALLIAHYGAGAPSLAASRDQISLEPDRASGKAVSVVYQVKLGPVTIASLTGRRGSYRMLIASGESIPAKEVFHGGVVANVRFKINHRAVLEKAKGMSHHWVLGIGDISTELAEFCEITGIRAVVV
jgi:L-arabinose isomerase